jgi:hypothetical protein
MNWKKYKTTISNDHCQGMVKLIEFMIVKHPAASHEDKLFLAALAEVLQHLKAKLVDYRREYKCTFTPVQSVAIECLLSQYMLPQVQRLGDFENRMLQIQSGIIKNYTTCQS